MFFFRKLRSSTPEIFCFLLVSTGVSTFFFLEWIVRSDQPPTDAKSIMQARQVLAPPTVACVVSYRKRSSLSR